MTKINLNVGETFNNIKTKTAQGAKKAYAASTAALGKGIKYTKNIAKDSFEFVKANPKKVGKFAAIGLAVGAFVATAATFIKKAINAHKHMKAENQVLKQAVKMNNETIATYQTVVEAQNEQIDVLSETVQDLKEKK